MKVTGWSGLDELLGVEDVSVMSVGTGVLTSENSAVLIGSASSPAAGVPGAVALAVTSNGPVFHGGT